MKRECVIRFLITGQKKFRNRYGEKLQEKWIFNHQISEKMGKLTVTISKGATTYGAWAEEVAGIYGQGDTVEDAKQSLREGLQLYKKHNATLPVALEGDVEIEYKYDVPSFLTHYATVFTPSSLERMTGIKQTQLPHYVSGIRKPSPKVAVKMDRAIQSLAQELQQVHFV
jgi:predicted RNase H-like HicB family nuclease